MRAYLRSIFALVFGVLRRAYWLLPGVCLQPIDLYSRILRRMFPALPDLGGDVSQFVLWVLFIVTFVWAVLDTYHRARMSKPPEEDISGDCYVTDAIRYVAFKSRVLAGALPTHGQTGDIELRARDLIHQAARNGDLVVWGREQVDLDAREFEPANRQIGSRYWEINTIDPSGMYLVEGANISQTSFLGMGHRNFGPRYTDLKFCKSQLRGVFSPPNVIKRAWLWLLRYPRPVRPDEWSEIDALPYQMTRGPLGRVWDWLLWV